MRRLVWHLADMPLAGCAAFRCHAMWEHGVARNHRARLTLPPLEAVSCCCTRLEPHSLCGLNISLALVSSRGESGHILETWSPHTLLVQGLAQLVQELAQLVQQLAQLVQQLAQLVQQLAQLVQQLAQLVQQLARLVQQLAQLVQQLAQLVQQLAQLVQQLAELVQQLARACAAVGSSWCSSWLGWCSSWLGWCSVGSVGAAVGSVGCISMASVGDHAVWEHGVARNHRGSVAHSCRLSKQSAAAVHGSNHSRLGWCSSMARLRSSAVEVGLVQQLARSLEPSHSWLGWCRGWLSWCRGWLSWCSELISTCRPTPAVVRIVSQLTISMQCGNMALLGISMPGSHCRLSKQSTVPGQGSNSNPASLCTYALQSLEVVSSSQFSNLASHGAGSTVGAAVGSVGAAVGSVGAAVGSVGAAVGSVGAAVGSVGAAVGSVGAAVGSVGAAVGSVGAAVGSVGAAVGSGLSHAGRRQHVADVAASTNIPRAG